MSSTFPSILIYPFISTPSIADGYVAANQTTDRMNTDRAGTSWTIQYDCHGRELEGNVMYETWLSSVVCINEGVRAKER
jgi:hypothetical protein